MAEKDLGVTLQPGVGFKLQPSGQWKPEKIPPDVLKEAKFSGYLTIQGYRCTVFEMPDKTQWAQKSTGTPAKPTTASKIADAWLRGHGAQYPKTDSMKSLVTTRVSLASRIASRWLRAKEEAIAHNFSPSSDPPDPQKYLIRIGQDAYVLVPFTENVIEDLAKLTSSSVLKGSQVLDALQGALGGTDVSVWMDGVGGDVEWMHGNDIDDALLKSMGIYDGQRHKSVASRIASRWLQAQQDITTQVKEKLERDGDDKEYDKAIVDFVEKTRSKLPPIDKALEKAADVLLKTREKIEHRHPKVQDRYVQLFLQELAQKHRELEDMRKQLMRGLTVELDRYEAEANVVE